MTYKTRQEVLRAAADWMDVCENAGVKPMLKWNGVVKQIRVCTFNELPNEYEFPIALLEGKEVWDLSEVYDQFGDKVVCSAEDVRDWSKCSWNPPKPKTVMVELTVEDVKELETWMFQSQFQRRIQEACKKALENLK